jgi:hypothetical protein
MKALIIAEGDVGKVIIAPTAAKLTAARASWSATGSFERRTLTDASDLPTHARQGPRAPRGARIVHRHLGSHGALNVRCAISGRYYRRWKRTVCRRLASPDQSQDSRTPRASKVARGESWVDGFRYESARRDVFAPRSAGMRGRRRYLRLHW